MSFVRFSSQRRVIGFLSVLVGSVVLSACGSSAQPTTTTTTTPATTTTIKSHVTSYPSCTTALLQITPNFGGAAAGGSYYRFVATSTSPTTCSLDGYPTLSFFAPNAAGGTGSGAAVSITTTTAGNPPAVVNLKHGASAQFLLGYTDVPVNGQGCTTVASVNVEPPHQSQSTPVPVSFSPCGGVVKIYAFAPPGTQNP